MIATLLILAAAQPALGTTKTKIGERTYRVTVEREQVVVANKGLVTIKSLDERDRARQAVRQVTGCELADDMWQGSQIVGRLRCGEASQAR